MRVVLDRLRWTAVAGVVDQRVELAEDLDRPLHQPLHIVFARHIRGHRDRFAAGVPDRRRGLLHQSRPIAPHRRRCAPSARERLTEHPADALARAGDDRDTVVQIPTVLHRVLTETQ